MTLTLWCNPLLSADIEDLEGIVEKIPRSSLNIPMQWFEMKSLIGWEKMMLVMGYADNRSVCFRLIDLAYAESTGREFRCSPAN
tara:strand:+ start:647 stop:898 length:252 start_codon:yes stop_codon:yes gene_type:complete